MDKITLRAYGKLNLSLDITGKRPDGYHLMDMVMQSVDLCDRVTLERSDRLDAALFPYGKKDTAYRAAQTFFAETGIPGGVRIQTEKHIPSEAGMGGGSADAAAVLKGLDLLFETGMGERLAEIGVGIGADVPFCLKGGTARVGGIGEEIQPLPFFGTGYYLVIKPPFGISTPAAFGAFDRLTDFRRPDTMGLIAAIKRRETEKFQTLSANVLEAAAARPEIGTIAEALRSAGSPFAQMSGSGSAVFGFFPTREAASAAKEAVAAYGELFLCRPVEQGVAVETTF